jgi:hypothetical protein
VDGAFGGPLLSVREFTGKDGSAAACLSRPQAEVAVFGPLLTSKRRQDRRPNAGFQGTADIVGSMRVVTGIPDRTAADLGVELALPTPSGRPDFSKADIAMNNGFPKRNVQVSLQSGKTACYWDREAAAGS